MRIALKDPLVEAYAARVGGRREGASLRSAVGASTVVAMRLAATRRQSRSRERPAALSRTFAARALSDASLKIDRAFNVGDSRTWPPR